MRFTPEGSNDGYKMSDFPHSIKHCWCEEILSCMNLIHLCFSLLITGHWQVRFSLCASYPSPTWYRHCVGSNPKEVVGDGWC